jgi:hypothetical protein
MDFSDIYIPAAPAYGVYISQKGQSETVYRRRTDNTMAKRKSTKVQTTVYKTLHIKLKIE